MHFLDIFFTNIENTNMGGGDNKMGGGWSKISHFDEIGGRFHYKIIEEE